MNYAFVTRNRQPLLHVCIRLYKEGKKQQNSRTDADATTRKAALVLISWVDSKSGAHWP